MMEFDVEELNKQFKKIQKTCFEEGLIIPSIIPSYMVDDDNRLNDKELKRLQVSEESKNKIYEAYKQRKKVEYSIFIGKNKEYKTYNEYHSKELENFLRQHSEFKDILKE